MTKPSRSLSNGRDAVSGSSLVERAVRAAKPAIPSGVIADSVPPATITSASPYWIERNASPIEFVPVAQAVTTLMDLPFKPYCIATLPTAMLLIIIGTSSGFTRFGPFSSIFLCSRSIACKLPIPEPMLVPTRNGSSFSISRPACAIASPAAATAYWENGSIRLAAFGSMYFFGSKSFTSPASFAL